MFDSDTEASRMQEWLEPDITDDQGSPVRYTKAKAAKVGTVVQCGWCSRPFTKKSYQQAFCCNKGSGNCKDRYWNQINPRGMGLYL